MAKEKTSKLDALRGMPTGIERQMPPAGGKRRRADKAGAPILLRLQDPLMARLDRARGGDTKQEKIRKVLEEHLPA